ncbi:unnamed protein product [Tenebrio molitor]|nr:unnamed protein product [Tenebrio molitor]
MRLQFVVVLVAAVAIIKGQRWFPSQYSWPEAPATNTDEQPVAGKRFLLNSFANLFRPRPKEPIVINQPPPPPPVYLPPPPPPPPPPVIVQQPAPPPQVVMQAPSPQVIYAEPQPSKSYVYRPGKTEMIYLR